MMTTMPALKPVNASPWKCGFTDGLMGRESNCPWKEFGRQQAYLRGYLKGQKDRRLTAQVS